MTISKQPTGYHPPKLSLAPIGVEDLSYLPDNFPAIVESLGDRVMSRAKHYFPELRQGFYLAEGGQIKGSSYPIFKFVITDGQLFKQVYIKFPPVEEDRNEGLNEYNNMTRMASIVSTDSEYQSPIPLDFWEDINGVVTLGVSGISLFELTICCNRRNASSYERQKLKNAIIRCGKWLKTYHKSSNIELQPLSNQEGNLLRQKLSFVDERFFPRVLIDKLEAFADKTILEIYTNNILVPTSVTHGDIALGNILVDDGKITVLDLEYTQRRPIFLDLGHLLTALETAWHLPRYLTYDRNNTYLLQEELLKSYGRYYIKGRERYLLLYWLAECTYRFESQITTLSKKLPRPLVAIGSRLLANKFRRIIDRLLKLNLTKEIGSVRN